MLYLWCTKNVQDTGKIRDSLTGSDTRDKGSAPPPLLWTTSRATPIAADATNVAIRCNKITIKSRTAAGFLQEQG
jgi:hypothetical protein